jgi:hypothetical protein
MPFIPLHLDTGNKTFRTIFNIPLIGGLLYLVLMMMAAAFPLVPICMACGLPEEQIPKILLFVIAALDIYLRKNGTKLSILFVPAWAMMTFIGILACFGVIR